MRSPVKRLNQLLGAFLVTASVMFAGVTVAAARTGAGIVPPNNPKESLQANPFWYGSSKCSYNEHPNSSVACDQLVLKAITNARSKEEKLGPMHFNLSAFRKLSVDKQLFALVDLERVERGLAPVEGLTHQLDILAWQAARAGADPYVPYFPYPLQGGGSAEDFGGNWAGGSTNALGSDYGWMYFDGPGGDNFECTKSDKSGCFGHRDNILSDGQGKWNWASPSFCGGGSYHFVMGTASTKSKTGWNPSQTELFVLDCGRAPSEYFTWTQAKKLLGI